MSAILSAALNVGNSVLGLFGNAQRIRMIEEQQLLAELEMLPDTIHPADYVAQFENNQQTETAILGGLFLLVLLLIFANLQIRSK